MTERQETSEWMHTFSEILLEPLGVEILRAGEAARASAE
jgi:hypothetical protein